MVATIWFFLLGYLWALITMLAIHVIDKAYKKKKMPIGLKLVETEEV